MFQIRFRIRMLLGLLDPHLDLLFICTDKNPSINKQKNEGNLDFYCFVSSLWPFIFEEWCKCTFKKELVFKKNIFCGHWRKEQDLAPDLDPLVKGTDPRIRIRIWMDPYQMSRIRNTGGGRFLHFQELPYVYRYLYFPPVRLFIHLSNRKADLHLTKFNF